MAYIHLERVKSVKGEIFLGGVFKGGVSEIIQNTDHSTLAAINLNVKMFIGNKILKQVQSNLKRHFLKRTRKTVMIAQALKNY